MIKVRIDDKVIEMEKGKRVIELLDDKRHFAARINGELADVTTEITEDCEL